METAERRSGGVTIVEVTGRLTAIDTPGRLKDKITSLVFQGEKKIVLDLSKVTYVDSSGLGELVSCHGTAARNGGEIKLAGAGSRMQDLLVMTKLLTVFDSHDTVDAAVEAFPAE